VTSSISGSALRKATLSFEVRRSTRVGTRALLEHDMGTARLSWPKRTRLSYCDCPSAQCSITVATLPNTRLKLVAHVDCG